jgi:hypothetical protein
VKDMPPDLRKTYDVWQSMKQRCLNPTAMLFEYYGGRGITVQESWKGSFQSFLEDMGCKPSGYTLERLDNELGYNKDNCKWTTYKEQSRNRRSSVKITFEGETLVLKDWADRLGISPPGLKYRLNNWPLEKALSK